MDEFDKLMHHFQTKNYGDLIMPCFELIAIVTGLRLIRKDKTVVLFLVYLIFDFSLCIVDIYLEATSTLSTADFIFFSGITNSLIALIELVVYFYFFSKILRNRTVIRFMKIFTIIFLIIILTLLLTRFSFLTKRFFYITNIIGAIEFFFLLGPCFVYFFELFQNDTTIKLHDRPSFWIVSGIFLYAVISIPYYLINRFVAVNFRATWPIIYLWLYCLPFVANFIFLTRAFLCKKILTT